MKTLSLNCKGLRDSLKRGSLLRWVASNSPDVVFLQETHATSESELKSWFLGHNFSAFGAFHTSRSRGVAILVKQNFGTSVSVLHRCTEGRSLTLRLVVRDVNLCLVCIYAPYHNPAKSKFFMDMKDLLDPT